MEPYDDERLEQLIADSERRAHDGWKARLRLLLEAEAAATPDPEAQDFGWQFPTRLCSSLEIARAQIARRVARMPRNALVAQDHGRLTAS